MRLAESMRGLFAINLLLQVVVGREAEHIHRPKFELRFQSEPDNSSIILREPEQQQIFKCQVKLAPILGQQANEPVVWLPDTKRGSFSSQRLKCSWSTSDLEPQEARTLANNSSNNKWPSLVEAALAIDWLKDGQALEEEANVINVTLKSNTKSDKIRQQQNSLVGQKRPRIEIKNTINNQQFKLTSRLRLAKLRLADSGRYKCVARVTYKQISGPTTRAPDETDQEASKLLSVDQSLHSNGAFLVIGTRGSPASNGNGTQRPRQVVGRAPKQSGDQAKEINGPDTSHVAPMAPPPAPTPPTGSEGGGAPASSTNNQFEDDEDLFRMELDKMELISGPQIFSLATNDNQDQEEGKLIDLDGVIMQLDGSNGAGSSVAAAGSSPLSPFPPNRDNEVNTNNNESSQAILANERESFADTKSSRRPPTPNGVLPAWPSPSPSSSQSLQPSQPLNDQILTTAKKNSIDLARQKIARFVHKIAPELSCYTGLGENYRGNVSTSSDQRPCLNWLHIRLFRFHQVDKDNSTGKPLVLTTPADNHNHCRNPNLDPRGPWCFVPYLEDIDGPDNNLHSNHWNGMQTKEYISGNKQTSSSVSARSLIIGSPNLHPKIQFVAQSCDIAPCSEYLWLYIVAPPLGLLILLMCLIGTLIRSIRRSHYDSILSSSMIQSTGLVDIGIGDTSSPFGPKKTYAKNHTARIGTKGLRRFLMARGPLVQKKISHSANKKANHPNKKKINYLDDIFDITDDIDFTNKVGNNNRHQSSSTSSPKSSESLRLKSSSTFSSSISNHDVISSASSGRQLINSSSNFGFTGNQCKSINPALNEKIVQNDPPQSISRPQHVRNGPMFATLRCQVKPTRTQQGNNLYRCQQDKSSPAIGLKEPLKSSTSTNKIRSSSSVMNLDQQQSPEYNETNCIVASDLPLLNESNISILYDQQPIFEGKFSQVQVAFMKQHQDDSTQATGMVGVQVGVCSLKQQASLIDETIFQAEKLRLKNLNHLNILKLIAHIENFNDHHGSVDQENSAVAINGTETTDGIPKSKQVNQSQQKAKVCALIYDMAHLIDLNDWLKEQNKDSLISNKDQTSELSLRQNLTCFAKQIALALDYLHDRNIVFKDLACRNCFIDVTKMLVKLASFNIEFDENTVNSGGDSNEEFSEQEQLHSTAVDTNRLNLKSMIRPKYLLDYYVIDSRPSECQLLPLSWIPLESILFNKFNRQTDVWSFGCLLYELFSLGEVAYFGYSSKQVIDSVRSNLMPPQPLLCPNGVYKLMCKCLSDIPTLRPNLKQIYEQLILYSGQCSSFLDHHLCSLATVMCNDSQQLKSLQGAPTMLQRQSSKGWAR